MPFQPFPIAVAAAAGPPGCDAAVIEESWTDPERFADIFGRYFHEIHRYIARRLGAQAADDLAAETFLAAFSRRKRYDVTRECARPWLYGIATNLIGLHRRAEGRFYRALARDTSAADLVSSGHEDQAADRVSAAGARPALLGALTELTPGDRDVVLLIALSGLGYQEVAEALGIPYGTVCSRLNRARRQLRRSMGGVNPADNPKESRRG